MPSKIHDSTMNVEDSVYVVAPTQTHTNTVIFLHGRDSTGCEFASDLIESQASDGRTLPETFPAVKWVFPTSKLRESARFKTEMSQWFDMWSTESPQERKELQVEGLRESIAVILSIIRKEASLVAPERIVLAGISQGCATAIYSLLYGGIRLGGFIGLCGWLPFADQIDEIGNRSSSDRNLLHNIRGLFKNSKMKSTIVPLTDDTFPNLDLAFKTPVFLAHAEDDDVVPIRNGDRLKWELEELGFDVTREIYEQGAEQPHWVNEPQGVDDIVTFLRERVFKA